MIQHDKTKNCKTNLFILAAIILLSSCGGGEKKKEADFISVDSLYLIPKPVLLEKREGYFTIDSQTALHYPVELNNEGEYLSDLIEASSQFSLPVNLESKVKLNSTIELKVVNDFPPELQHGEAYRILIDENNLQISALTSTGIMRGIQTLRQLFVPAFSSDEKRSAWFLPCLKIEDKPSFEHRGLLLDVCRHFFEKEVVLKYIDALAYYKMNVLHFHLTEDQGWRMAIDKYPLLNEISSYRTEKDGSIYGGFYTKEELKEIVAYAAERHIVVIPEIELPGHAQAALAAYPQYSCNGGPIEVANDWGVFKEIYCAGNDSTFLFLQDILTEVMEIFPSEYIHIGGDEAPKFRWEHCSKCQQRMKNEGLADEHELQSYFIQRIEKFLNDNGRKLVGWDEILEGGLSENATVQSWRGTEGGMAAARQNHYVIMSPTSHCYLDYGLDAIDLKKVYSFNPIPAELEAEFHTYILGAEVNMWTERVPDEADLDSKVFPRVIALAEMLWSGPDSSRYDDFYARIQHHYPILMNMKIQYGTEMIPLKIETYQEKSFPQMSLDKQLNELELKYRVLCDGCDTNWIDYTQTLELDKSGVLEVMCYKNGLVYGDTIRQPIASHMALFSEVSYLNPWSKYYPSAGNKALVDGKLGSINFRDGNWQGFSGNDVVVDLYLGRATAITQIKINAFQYVNAWIINPAGFKVFASDNNEQWRELKMNPSAPQITQEQNDTRITQYTLDIQDTETKFIRVMIKNAGKLPASHEAAGQDSWLFIDELMIN